MAVDQVGQNYDLDLGDAKYVRWTNGTWTSGTGIWADGGTTYTGLVVSDEDHAATGESNRLRDNTGAMKTKVIFDKGNEISLTAAVSTAGTAIPHNADLEIGGIVELSVDNSAFVRYMCTARSVKRDTEPGNPASVSMTVIREDDMAAVYDAT